MSGWNCYCTLVQALEQQTSEQWVSSKKWLHYKLIYSTRWVFVEFSVLKVLLNSLCLFPSRVSVNVVPSWLASKFLIMLWFEIHVRTSFYCPVYCQRDSSSLPRVGVFIPQNPKSFGIDQWYFWSDCLHGFANDNLVFNQLGLREALWKLKSKFHCDKSIQKTGSLLIFCSPPQTFPTGTDRSLNWKYHR